LGVKAEWLANVDGQEYGPYTWQQMLQMAAEGRVPSDLPVRRVSDKRWFKAAQVPGLVTPAAPPAAAGSSVAPPPAPSAAKRGDSQLKRARPLTAAGGVAAAPPASPPPRTAESPRTASTSHGAAVPVIVTEPRPKTASSAVAADQPQVPRRGKSLLLAGIAVGVTAVVLLGAATIVWMVWLRGNGANQQVPVAAAAPESNPNQPIEAGPPAGSARVVATAGKPAEKTSDGGPTKDELAAQAKLVQSISNWKSLAGFESITLSSAKIQVTRVWQTDAAGDDQDQDSARKYVCVEVAIGNTSRSPLKYRGWNSYGPNGAILADESKQVLPLVPVAKTPDIKRVTTTSVPGNGRVTDVLVFAAPASDDEVLHLVLPYGVFYSNVRPPYRAIELTPDMMNVDLAAARAGTRVPGGEGEDIVRSPPAGPTPSRDDEPPAPANGTAPATAPSESKGVPKGKDGKTPSIKDLIDNDPGTPARPDDPPKGKDDPGKPTPKTDGKKPESPKKPENPFEPKPADDSPKPPAVVPKGKSE
jgi:hypothetical protein